MSWFNPLRMLQPATSRPKHPTPVPVPVPQCTAKASARVVYAPPPAPDRQVDGPTTPLPPVQQRYVSRHADMRGRNRQSGPVPARRGSTRAAVGL